MEGSAWDQESEGKWWRAYRATLTASLFRPKIFFAEGARGQGMVRPWVYALINSCMVVLMVASFRASFPFAFVLPLSFIPLAVLALIVVPVVMTVGLFIQAGLYHLCLSLVGATHRPFADTFRVVCYSSGPQLLQIIPFLGTAIGGIWSFVLNFIGLKEVHQVSTGRCLLAMALPLLVCGFVLLLFLSALAGGIVAAFMQS